MANTFDVRRVSHITETIGLVLHKFTSTINVLRQNFDDNYCSFDNFEVKYFVANKTKTVFSRLSPGSISVGIIIRKVKVSIFFFFFIYIIHSERKLKAAKIYRLFDRCALLHIIM